MKAITFLYLTWLFCSVAHATTPFKVTLLPGDTQSAAAVAAVVQLQKDPAFKDVQIQVLVDLGLSEAEHAQIRASDLLLLSRHSRTLVPLYAEDARAVLANGGRAVGVVESLDLALTEAGVEKDAALTAYFTQGGSTNIAQMLRAALAQSGRSDIAYAPPVTVPEAAYFEVKSAQFFIRFEDYAAAYLQDQPKWKDRPWVGVSFGRNLATSGETEALAAIVTALEAKGLNALPTYGYPADKDIEAQFMDAAGQSRIEAIVALAFKFGNIPAKLIPKLERLDVPIVNAISLFAQTRAEWEASEQGIDHNERSWQVGAPELAGAIAPIVISAKERIADPDTGMSYVTSVPIAERVERLASRVQKLIHLRQTPAAEKRVAVMYYNFPPGGENIGASYLNVLPGSLWQILQRLRAEGFNATSAPASSDELFTSVRSFGSNPHPGADAEFELLVNSGRAQLLPVAEYREWFEQMPVSMQQQMIAKWGEPEQSGVMLWP